MTAPKVVSRVRVKVGAESYVFDRNSLTLNDAYAIKAASGLNMNPFLSGVMEGDPVALQTLVWFLRFKDGNNGDRLQINFSFGDFVIEPIADDDEDDPNPTQASSETSETAISDSSHLSVA